MLDIHAIRKNPAILQQALHHRHYPPEALAVAEEILLKDEQWRKTKKEEEALRAERNELNLSILQAKKSKKEKEAQKAIVRSGKVSVRIKEISEQTKKLEEGIRFLLLGLPNLPDASVPDGKDASANPTVRTWGKPVKHSKDVKSHDVLATKTRYIDFERGAKLAGHRFAVLRGPVAQLERALINFMLGLHASNGYEEVWPPHMVNTAALEGTGQLPKFESDQYRCRDDNLWLVPTAEVPLTNLYAGEVLEEAALPLKLTAYTPCYRREAGAYGKDIKGLIRQHQFNKVELVKFAPPERSMDELETLTRDAESVLQALGLPYRVVELCTGDLGFAAAKTYDIEVWVPSQNTYREISSCSNCTDFQARRANIKFRGRAGLSFVHTLNGSGLAVGRTLIAILENFQEDNVVTIPKPLQDYTGFETIEF